MKTEFKLSILVGFLLLLFSSCTSDGNGKNISKYLSERSHNMGMNCMQCHKENGGGDGWFVAAGTVYDSLLVNTYPGATVKLYSGPNGTGTLIHTIEVDTKGNFHTTEAIDFGAGLYPVVVGNIGKKYMSSSISMGQCNSCHGVTTGKIWTK
jgi:hypothetical protein